MNWKPQFEYHKQSIEHLANLGQDQIACIIDLEKTELSSNKEDWSWGWALELKYDSRPCFGFKEVFCMVITDPPVAQPPY